MEAQQRSRRAPPAPPRNQPPPPYNAQMIGTPPPADNDQEMEERRLVIAIDYGTTYTGVAFATPVGNRADLDEIEIIHDWGLRMSNRDKIPSVISYSLCGPEQEQQWGTDLSSDAIAMVHTKLQLDVNEPSGELDLILQALDGMRNLDIQYIIDSKGVINYPHEGPEEIVEDYLKNIWRCVLNSIAHFTVAWRMAIPVDIVVTIPARWGFRAKNSTFRAIKGAGFDTTTFPQLRDLLLVSEPEAAAVYTARSERERRVLKKDDYFVLCDAGGGTVDVVAYRVKQLQPTFEIERETRPTGDKCGSIFVNLAFKDWLRGLIGDERYQQLDQAPMDSKISSHHTEGERMRELMRGFEIQKKGFTTNSGDIRIDLPEPFENLNMDGVVGGEITIPFEVMESFFKTRASRIVELIDGQRQQIAKKRSRVQNVFLVGGFAESLYLQEVVKNSLVKRHIDLWVPDDSWTAVVRGAAIFGIEKSSNKSITKMTACDRSYGVSYNAPFSDIAHDREDHYLDLISKTAMAEDQLMWLVKKDDLILSDEPKEATATFTKKVVNKDSTKGTIPIYVYDGCRDRIPDRLADAENELKKIHMIKYDLKDISLREFPRSKPAGRGSSFYVVSLSLTLGLKLGKIHLRLNLRDEKGPLLYKTSIPEPPFDS
ncbi:hypothetical protein EG329_013203 [Mollisiaceae sp. DMI_Dod_QoI]|nr:hypothetical protein EG329_013203 [Helotiales sp. DMI_Dod_QoI]